jgi:hypothetical protein
MTKLMCVTSLQYCSGQGTLGYFSPSMPVRSCWLLQAVEELVAYLQAARMLAAAAKKKQPPTAELAALAPNGAAPQAPQEMEIDGARLHSSCKFGLAAAHMLYSRDAHCRFMPEPDMTGLLPYWISSLLDFLTSIEQVRRHRYQHSCMHWQRCCRSRLRAAAGMRLWLTYAPRRMRCWRSCLTAISSRCWPAIC